MKFVVRAHHIVSLGGYIVERNFPYKNVILVNKTDEPIKVEIPVFDKKWIEEHRNLGIEVIPVKYEDSFLTLFRKAQSDLEVIREELS
ncbi:energy-converting hydrogenase B subunit P [Methanobrevibacter cuticularis]|uniref:Energy-converting hydrogenase B subunit P n=1 Tax=Methanobrevibacter cuticularis TaxID=47311 RepID=A0A166CNN5_9EURY|nr:energy-converting hydrogenase B subunit EhbP [Methanobrevibacter cuticularis]KZX15677.1 energy-converting hydrogenase B subunit P [Methanobrevibacter cuticularis]